MRDSAQVLGQDRAMQVRGGEYQRHASTHISGVLVHHRHSVSKLRQSRTRSCRSAVARCSRAATRRSFNPLPQARKQISGVVSLHPISSRLRQRIKRFTAQVDSLHTETAESRPDAHGIEPACRVSQNGQRLRGSHSRQGGTAPRETSKTRKECGRTVCLCSDAEIRSYIEARGS